MTHLKAFLGFILLASMAFGFAWLTRVMPNGSMLELCSGILTFFCALFSIIIPMCIEAAAD